MADQTLMIVKPDAVAKNAIGQIVARVEGDGFVVRQLRMMHLSREQAEEFYDVHKERPFYGELVDFMTSGPAVPMVLERADAVPHLREFIGPTNSNEAPAGTIRGDFGMTFSAMPCTRPIRPRMQPEKLPSSSESRCDGLCFQRRFSPR